MSSSGGGRQTGLEYGGQTRQSAGHEVADTRTRHQQKDAVLKSLIIGNYILRVDSGIFTKVWINSAYQIRRKRGCCVGWEGLSLCYYFLSSLQCLTGEWGGPKSLPRSATAARLLTRQKKGRQKHAPVICSIGGRQTSSVDFTAVLKFSKSVVGSLSPRFSVSVNEGERN